MAKYVSEDGVKAIRDWIKDKFSLKSHTHDYLPLTGGTINANNSKTPLILKGGINNYREGLRIIPSNNWSTILLASNDVPETEGTSPNSWSIHNNDGKFYISKNGSDYASVKLSNTDGTWKVNDNTIIHSGNIGSQGVSYANSAGSATCLSNTATISGNNTATYPWRRILSIPSTTANYYDSMGTYYLSGNYNGGPYYLFRVEFRTNNSTSGGGGNFNIRIIATNTDPKNLAIASYSVANNGVTTSYSDIFVKVGPWPRMTLTRLSAHDYGVRTYYSSNEGYNASSRTEAYTGINGSGTGYASYELHSLSAYTYVSYGELTASVDKANFINPHQNVTSTGKSTWDPTGSGKIIWGQSFVNSSIDSGDTGDLTLFLRPASYTYGTELCMNIDGDYYSMGVKVARMSDISNMVTTNTAQTITGYKKHTSIGVDTINGATLGNAIVRQNTSTGEVILGSTVRPLRLWGNQTRPSYSKNDGANYSELALLSDIPSIYGVSQLYRHDIEFDISNGDGIKCTFWSTSNVKITNFSQIPYLAFSNIQVKNISNEKILNVVQWNSDGFRFYESDGTSTLIGDAYDGVTAYYINGEPQL